MNAASTPRLLDRSAFRFKHSTAFYIQHRPSIISCILASSEHTFIVPASSSGCLTFVASNCKA